MDFNKDNLAKEQALYKRIYSMPIMIKANDILDLINAICASMPDDDNTGDTLKVEGLEAQIAFIKSKISFAFIIIGIL